MHQWLFMALRKSSNELNHCIQSYYNCFVVNCVTDAVVSADAFSNISWAELQLRCKGPDSHKQTKYYTSFRQTSSLILFPILNLFIPGFSSLWYTGTWKISEQSLTLNMYCLFLCNSVDQLLRITVVLRMISFAIPTNYVVLNLYRLKGPAFCFFRFLSMLLSKYFDLNFCHCFHKNLHLMLWLLLNISHTQFMPLFSNFTC